MELLGSQRVRLWFYWAASKVWMCGTACSMEFLQRSLGTWPSRVQYSLEIIEQNYTLWGKCPSSDPKCCYFTFKAVALFIGSVCCIMWQCGCTTNTIWLMLGKNHSHCEKVNKLNTLKNWWLRLSPVSQLYILLQSVDVTLKGRDRDACIQYLDFSVWLQSLEIFWIL